MKKSDHIKYWLQSASHDLDTAESMYQSLKYDWCLFIGHLVLEKTLKAIYIDRHGNNIPPKLHNLVRLAELCHHELSEEQNLFLDKVNDFNIQTRYPDYKLDFYRLCTKDFAHEYFIKIKDFYYWLLSRLK